MKEQKHGTPGCYKAGCRLQECRDAHNRQRKRREWEMARGINVRVPAAPAQKHVKDLHERGMPLAGIARLAGGSVTDDDVRRLYNGGSRHSAPVLASEELCSRVLDVKFDPAMRKQGYEPTGDERRLKALIWKGQRRKEIIAGLRVDPSVLDHILNGTREYVSWAVHERIVAYYAANWMRDGGDKPTKRRARQKGYFGPGAWNPHTIDDPNVMPDPGAYSGFEDDFEEVA